MNTQAQDSELHQAAVDAIDGQGRVALAAVLRSSGSTPRKTGTKALIDARGMIRGTIGGGLLESEAQRRAVMAIQSGRAEVFDFRFAGERAAEPDPVCGGSMRVLVAPLSAADRPAYAAAADAVRRRRRGVLLTRVDATGAVCTQWMDATEPAPGDLADALAGAVAGGMPVYVRDQTGETLVEPVAPQPLLLIAGGGHVGSAVAAQAKLVGFDVVVIDDRPEFADASRQPAGVSVRCGRFAQVIEELAMDSDTCIVIVGRSHRQDIAALAACIDKPAGYIGMMGSRRKVRLVRGEFLDSGRATAEQFDRVHAPIGLEIGAQTVPEIALAIVAQLVAVRRRSRPGEQR